MKLYEVAKRGKSLLDVPELAQDAGKEVGGDFRCSSNQLTSLEGAPSSVGGDFRCSNNNNLTSLEGAPSSVGGNFDCSYNNLTSLEGAPSSVSGNFDCSSNQLTSLEGAPSSVGGDFRCHSNQLTSLEGAPSSVGGIFSSGGNNLTSLEDIHLHIKRVGGIMYLGGSPIKSHVLGVLLIKGVTEVRLKNEQVQEILNRHLPSKGMRSVLEAQHELMAADLNDFAEL